MLRKDFLVTIRHPVLLVLELLIPALLFLTICDDRFKPAKMQTHDEILNLTKFNLSQRSIAYYPSTDHHTSNWIKAMETLYEEAPTTD
jgi:hypothetical protein